MSFEEARIDRFRFYQTRCNICGKKHNEPSHAYFFMHNGNELQCCENCKNRASSVIVRKEYWDRQYDEPDAGQPLWRYVDLAKFLDMILFKRIWFAQVATLDDTFEGALGSKVRQDDWRKWMFEFLFKAVKNPPPEHEQTVSDEYAKQQAQRLLADTEKSLAMQKSDTYVSCWHIAKHESFLMWKVYANNRPESVCIKTNLVRLRKCLGDRYRIGVVRYIDFKKTFPDVNWPFLYKRAAFIQENEARIFFRGVQNSGVGFYADINPLDLIDEVLVSPEAPQWLIENIKRLIELSGIFIPFRVSDLSEEPF